MSSEGKSPSKNTAPVPANPDPVAHARGGPGLGRIGQLRQALEHAIDGRPVARRCRGRDGGPTHGVGDVVELVDGIDGGPAVEKVHEDEGGLAPTPGLLALARRAAQVSDTAGRRVSGGDVASVRVLDVEDGQVVRVQEVVHQGKLVRRQRRRQLPLDRVGAIRIAGEVGGRAHVVRVLPDEVELVHQIGVVRAGCQRGDEHDQSLLIVDHLLERGPRRGR